MFFFGDPQDIADNYIAEALAEPGPVVYESVLEDMTVEQLTYATVYSRMAIRRAQDDEAPQEVLDCLFEVHDELFCHMAARNPDFVRSYRIRHYKHLEYGPGKVEKYDALLEQYAPSAD